MKPFVWLLTLSLAILSAGCWAVSHLVVHALRVSQAGLAVPNFTRWVLLPHGWMLLCPVPWIIYASVLTLKREITPSAACLFAGTLALAAVSIAVAVAVACVLPQTQLVEFLKR